ncbi:MAG: carboxynorspermidine decarboxylase [Firmicutes bacterium]|nr:carboxynorspermidine decarboxylase [Bacillota bacterium]
MKDCRAPFKGLMNLKLDSFNSLKTPCYVLDEKQLKKNGEILKGVQDRTGCKILLAQKAFSNYDMYPVLEPYLAGSEASGLFEARLGKEEMPNKEVHVFCGAYREDEMDELLKYADHIVFNSPYQIKKFGKKAKQAGKSIGLRINPECSTQDGHEIYDPCAPGSRLGTTREQWNQMMDEETISLLDGLHFHTLCEQNSDALQTTLEAVEKKFGDVLPKMKWLNMGGGHHITREDYDIDCLEKCIKKAIDMWQVEVYLEPGEACALNAGYLFTRVLDVLKNGNTSLAILDMSAACHTPDVIEMPYKPPLYNAAEENEKAYTIRLGGPTCLAGDVIGDYSFDQELERNQLLIFGDMAIYSTCKNNTFNGMPLPSILCLKEDGSIETLKEFDYSNFKCRLGSK